METNKKITKLQVLSENQLDEFEKIGFLVLNDFFTPEDVSKMITWIEEIAQWPVTEGQHLNYYEVSEDKKRLSRTENFLPFHQEFKSFLNQKGAMKVFEDIFGEDVILFKEKINYKYPNTGEYPPHQEVHASELSELAFQPYHRNMAIFLDDSNRGNGCLELGYGFEKNKILPHHSNGELTEEIVDSLEWKPLELKSGSVLLCDMFWPHRSSENKSQGPRRTIFLTVNGKSKGDLRNAHFQDRASGKPKTREISPKLVVQTLLTAPYNSVQFSSRDGDDMELNKEADHGSRKTSEK